MRNRLSCRGPSARSQRGVTLFVALVLLVMVTLLAVSSFRVSNTNLKVVGSMQGKTEGLAAANAAIESAISNVQFVENPLALAAQPMAVDLNADGTPEYQVSFNPPPTCLKSRQTRREELDIAKPADAACFGSGLIEQKDRAVVCFETVWEVTATTKDPVTSAETVVRQGVGLRTSKDDALNSCK